MFEKSFDGLKQMFWAAIALVVILSITVVVLLITK
jgi:cytochrome b subunit of formate dehydrogenase